MQSLLDMDIISTTVHVHLVPLHTLTHSYTHTQSLCQRLLLLLSQVLLHAEAASPAAAFRGPGGNGKQGIGRRLGRGQSTVFIHQDVPQSHVRVQGGGGGVVKLGKAECAKVQWAADGDPYRGS